MPGLSMSQLADLTTTTLEDLPKLQFETPLQYQDYIAVNQFLRGGKGRRIEFQSGYGIKRNIMLTQSANAKHVQQYESTAVNVADVQSQLTAPWAHAQTHWSIERREALMNRAPARFVDLLESRRVDAMLSLADLLEERAWKSINTSADTRNPRGIPYHVTIGADAENGFYGGQTRDEAGTAITSVSGITPVDQDRWCNYYSDYAGPTAADAMVQKMHEVYRKIRFKAPRIVKDLDRGPLSGYAIYVDGTTIDEYEEYTRKSNDNIGYDVGKFAGNTAFQRVPITWVPILDTASTSTRGANPIYFINHNKFKMFVLRGDNLRESEPMVDRNQHNVITTFVDLSYNYICLDRRSQGLISTL